MTMLARSRPSLDAHVVVFSAVARSVFAVDLAVKVDGGCARSFGLTGHLEVSRIDRLPFVGADFKIGTNNSSIRRKDTLALPLTAELSSGHGIRSKPNGQNSPTGRRG